MKNKFVKKGYKLRMGKGEMADVMYAVLATKSELSVSDKKDVNEYTRRQNVYHSVEILLKIPTDKVELFKELSGVKLGRSKKATE